MRKEELLGAIADALPMGVAYFDTDRRCRFINSTYEEHLGRSREQTVGKGVEHVLGSKAHEKIRPHMDGALSGRATSYETRVQPDDGPSRWFNTLLLPHVNEQDEVEGCVVCVRDITELKDSEGRVREQLAELDHIYHTAPVGLSVLDKDMRCLRINERLAALDGMPPADHIGRTIREMVPQVADRVEPICRSVLDTGEPVLDLQVRAVRPTDPPEEMVGLMSCYPLKSADGGVRGVSAVVHDITELKRAEEALRESEERLARVLESAMDAIITIDEQRNIRLFNAAAEDVFGRSAAEVIGKPFDGFASDGFRELLDNCERAFGRSGARRRYMWAPEGLTAVRGDQEEFPVEATVSQFEFRGEKFITIILRDVNDRVRAEEQLRKLQLQNLYLQEEARTEFGFETIVGDSPAFKKVLESVEAVAATDSTVLLAGETGTGKELIAHAIHSVSKRKDKILVKVNCAALPAGVIESELFGHEKGAFTGATRQRIGRFELANGGTIFLDEIGDLSPELQTKLLRVLQEGEFERVGGSQTLKVDVRVIAATNHDLEKDVQEERFRSDLYYRLNVFPIRIPPLRERTVDIPALLRHFAMIYGAKIGKKIGRIPEETMKALMAYDWPGNVRELQNVTERAIILSHGPDLEPGEWLPAKPGPSPARAEPRFQTLEELERQHILKVLGMTGGRVSGDKGAAKILGLKRSTLESRMQKLGIKRH